jgi:hypothetical protein
MEIKDAIEFRRLQVMFFAGMVEYPNDKERMEAGLRVLEKYIDTLVERECSKIISRTAEIRMGGQLKGKGGTA